MTLSKKTVQAISAGATVLILAVGGFSANLIHKNTENMKVEAETLQKANEANSNKIASLKNGTNTDIAAAQEVQSQFNTLITSDDDVESASRAIAEALPSGVKINSFTFGASSPVMAGGAKATVDLSGFTPTATSGASSSSSSSSDSKDDADKEKETSDEEGSGESSSATGLSQIPWTIVVTANSYEDLSSYLDNLATQPRLLKVLSVDTMRGDVVNATIYISAYRV